MIKDEIIKNIKKNLSILEVVKFFVHLRITERKRTIYGQCPFCFAPSTAFNLNLKLNHFRCFACGKGGTPIDFIKKYQKLSNNDAIQFIINKFYETLKAPISYIDDSFVFNHPIRGHSSFKGCVYVLQLENECFYVGYTNDIELRWIEHKHGFGSTWTRINKPIKIILIHPNQSILFENSLTEKYIEKYGYNKVRGGDHFYFEEKYGDILKDDD